jgi:hypothetical protein
MRLLINATLLLGTTLGFAHAASAQTTPTLVPVPPTDFRSLSSTQAAQAPGNERAARIAFDLTPVGLALTAAATTSPKSAVGLSVGIGGNWWNYMVLAGSHFSQERGFSYEKKDGATGKGLFEVLHGSVYMRRYISDRSHLDVGLKGSLFAHFDSSDDEPGGGRFLGAHVNYMWWGTQLWGKKPAVRQASGRPSGGWVHFGSQLDVGSYAEGSRGEFGINVAPIVVRIGAP